MTDILLINPNTTQSITDLVLKTARRFAAKGTNLRAVTGTFGPRYIASRVGYAIAGHAAVDALANDRHAKDAVVLACFGDPGLDALREIAKVPVVGMADASILQACAVGRRFSIVTGGERWKSMLEDFVSHRGLASRLACRRGDPGRRRPGRACSQAEDDGRCASAGWRCLRDFDGRDAGPPEAGQGRPSACCRRKRRPFACIGEAAWLSTRCHPERSEGPLGSRKGPSACGLGMTILLYSTPP